MIYKQRKLLEAWQGSRLLKRYKAVSGRSDGAKRFAGDGKTPEGRYVIDKRHRSKQYHRFLHISYPNAADRARFRQAKRAGRIPAGKGIGSAIGIHGQKKGRTWLPHKWVNWTQGCVAVDNAEIEELYRAVKHRAVVEIKP